jgi:uncharacterized protein
MKRSLYTKYIDNYPEPGQHLLFSTLNHGIMVVDDVLRLSIENLDKNASSIPAEYKKELRDQLMIVKNEKEDKKLLETYFNEVKKTAESSLEVTILTTFACNFACVYCVEDGVISNIKMDEETAEKTVEYIQKEARRLKVDAIHLYFYGGEPLMHIPPIRSIAAKIGAFCEKKGLDFAFALTTNGALLKPSLVLELAEIGLEGVKITIDGDREHHNAKRPYKNGRGSFDDIIKNIRFAVNYIAVDIGGNFDEENSGSFEALIAYLKDEGLESRLNRVSFKPISQTPEDRKSALPTAELECVYARDDTADSMIKLRKLLIDNGFSTDEGIGVNICGITLNDTQFTVDPTGVLYKCPAFVGREEFAVGTLDEGFEKTNKLELWRRCAHCEDAALCGDGCMYGAYIQYGDAEKLNCQKVYMDTVVTENLKLEYDRIQRQGG